jgi:hypothetical protein
MCTPSIIFDQYTLELRVRVRLDYLLLMESGARRGNEESRGCSTPTGSLSSSFSTDRRTDDEGNAGSFSRVSEAEEKKAEQIFLDS